MNKTVIDRECHIKFLQEYNYSMQTSTAKGEKGSVHDEEGDINRIMLS